jgi:hypothetical protein
MLPGIRNSGNLRAGTAATDRGQFGLKFVRLQSRSVQKFPCRSPKCHRSALLSKSIVLTVDERAGGRAHSLTRRRSTICQFAFPTARRDDTGLRRVACRRAAYLGDERGRTLRRPALVSLMEAANVRNCDDASDARRLHRSAVRRVFAQSEMRPTSVVVRQVCGEPTGFATDSPGCTSPPRERFRPWLSSAA